MNAEQLRHMTECETRAWGGEGEDWRQGQIEFKHHIFLEQDTRT